MKKYTAILLAVLTCFLTACGTAVAPPRIPGKDPDAQKVYLPGEEPSTEYSVKKEPEATTGEIITTTCEETTAQETTAAEATTEETTAEVFEKYKPQYDETVVNVKDFGAVGDGKTDDEAAIVRAIYHAVNNLPATVYFPEGEYGLLDGGIYIYMPQGSGRLTIAGDGPDKSVIKYLDEWTTKGSWVALRIMPKEDPTKLSEYIHDITISDICIRDTDPVKHAWTIEEDGSKEETHGIDIKYCVRATVRNCLIDSVGDEAIDMVYCTDSQIVNNVVLNSPGAGTAGGAISVGDGCNGVVVRNNVVDGTIDAEGKSNFGIALEALTDPVKNVEVYNNKVINIKGYAVNIGAPNSTIDNVVLRDNEIKDSTNGIRLMGIGEKSNIEFKDNTVTNVEFAVYLEGGNSKDIVFKGNTIDTVSNRAVHIVSASSVGTLFEGGTIKNCQKTAVFNGGTDTKIHNVRFENIGLEGNVKTAAILQYTEGGSMELSGVTINCLNAKAIQGAQKIIDTVIEQPEESGYASIAAATVIKGGKVNRAVYGLSSGGLIDGLEIKATKNLGMHAITLLDTTDCTIKNCTIRIPSRDAIHEMGASDRNIFMNNDVNASFTVVGPNTIVIK